MTPLSRPKASTLDESQSTEPVEAPRDNISGGRESVESFVFVFLFFLVLGIEAEGFVIPTGSMAPTLMGRHKEVTCPECGYVYAVNADREVNESVSLPPRSRYVEAGTCVNCRFQAKIDDDPNFQGDRIYVLKTPLDLPFVNWLGTATLKRWNVAVFKLPEEPEIRYIKRLVGMPGEILRILRGDIWVQPADTSAPFQRAYRPLAHQDAMQMLVHDDRQRSKTLAEDPIWNRWQSRQEGDWTEEIPGVYRVASSALSKDHVSELRYRHVFPDPNQWDAIVKGEALPYPPRPTLITDFYSYNTDLTLDALSNPGSTSRAWSQANWVGDLSLSLRLEVAQPSGTLSVELVKAGISNHAEIDFASGQARLFHGDTLLGSPMATNLSAAGTYTLILSNIDDRLNLRIDGETPFGEGVPYGQVGDPVVPTAADLDPAGVSARGAAVTVSDLVLKRDIYYTLDPTHADVESLDLEHPLPRTCREFFDWLGDPERFGDLAGLQPHDYPIASGHYMMLGDNSPWSRDGRAWSRDDQLDPHRPGRGWDGSGRESWEVPEALLIGKAFCVYWPHPVPFGPTIRLGRDTRLPIRPGFEKMRWIR